MDPRSVSVILRSLPSQDLSDFVGTISALLLLEPFRLQMLSDNFEDLIVLCEIFEKLADLNDTGALSILLQNLTDISSVDPFSTSTLPEKLCDIWTRWIGLDIESEENSYLRTAGLTLLGNFCVNGTYAIS